MRPGNNGELIFESETEARVATQLVLDIHPEAGMALYSHCEPLPESPFMGRTEFVQLRICERLGIRAIQEVVIKDREIARVAAHMLQVARVPDSPWLPQPPAAISRRGFLEKTVRDFNFDRFLFDLNEEGRQQ